MDLSLIQPRDDLDVVSVIKNFGAPAAVDHLVRGMQAKVFHGDIPEDVFVLIEAAVEVVALHLDLPPEQAIKAGPNGNLLSREAKFAPAAALEKLKAILLLPTDPTPARKLFANNDARSATPTPAAILTAAQPSLGLARWLQAGWIKPYATGLGAALICLMVFGPIDEDRPIREYKADLNRRLASAYATQAPSEPQQSPAETPPPTFIPDYLQSPE